MGGAVGVAAGGRGGACVGRSRASSKTTVTWSEGSLLAGVRAAVVATVSPLGVAGFDARERRSPQAAASRKASTRMGRSMATIYTIRAAARDGRLAHWPPSGLLPGSAREHYLAGLKDADRGSMASLMAFVRT